MQNLCQNPAKKTYNNFTKSGKICAKLCKHGQLASQFASFSILCVSLLSNSRSSKGFKQVKGGYDLMIYWIPFKDGLTLTCSAFRFPHGDKSSVQGFQFYVLKFFPLSKRIFEGFELVLFCLVHLLLLGTLVLKWRVVFGTECWIVLSPISAICDQPVVLTRPPNPPIPMGMRGLKVIWVLP